MDEFDKYYENEFFIIDSNNIDSINSKLYGFAISGTEIIQNQEITSDFNNIDYGIFINLKVNDDEIIITQDFNGSYTLYLFKEDNYFAISNSFWKLVEHIKDNFNLSVNEDFAKSLFKRNNIHSFSYNNTLVNEINSIDRNQIIHINKKTNELSFEQIDYEESTVDINSKEGLKLLDSWFNRWIQILRSLKEKTNNINFNLTGDIPSRVIFSILLNANIDLNKVNFSYLTDSLKSSKDSSSLNEMASMLGFKLDQDVFSSEKIYFNDMDTIINSSSLLKLGFNNNYPYNFAKYKDPVYSFNSRGANVLKGWLNISKDEFVDSFVYSTIQYIFSAQSSKNLIEGDLENLQKNYKEDNEWLAWRYYKESISRNDCGKDSVEEYFSNIFSLSPFYDPILNKLKLTTDECDDRELLIAVILTRYAPELLDYKIEGKSINFQTENYAKSLNEKYPYKPLDLEYISGPEIDLANANPEPITRNDLIDYLKNVFYDDEFKSKFVNLVSLPVYEFFTGKLELTDYYTMQYFSPSFSVIKIYDDVEGADFEYSNISQWIKHYASGDVDICTNFINSNLSKYYTGRIDFKNFSNSTPGIDFLECSDTNMLFNKYWVDDKDSKGISILSQDVNLSLKLKVKGEGILRLFLTATDFPDINKKKIPIYVDFKKVILNNDNLLDSSKLVSLRDKYSIDIDVSEGDILDFKFKWLPVTIYSDSENINQDLKKMTERYENLRYKKEKRKAEQAAARAAMRAERAAAREAARAEAEAARRAKFIEENPLRNFPVSDEVIIDVDDISMEFVLAEEKVDNFKEYVIRFLKRELPEKTKFKALNHVSFKVHKGERLGIIGFNGAGKSTLLKILSGVMKPTEGTVTVKGGVAPLLELGAGFDINYTGEENIFLNGSILGYQREFLEEKFDEIVEFSELGHFIKVPIKNYSSGMKAKLGFSVATIVNPDILILDEVLSVGDVKFKQKSKEKLEELMGEGVTVIMVTHSVSAIRKMCNKVIWLDQGNLIRYGDVDEICDEYVEFAKSGTKEDLKNIKLH
ncbi:ABC transporter ATP-binding protein [Methanobrevibacter sp.]